MALVRPTGQPTLSDMIQRAQDGGGVMANNCCGDCGFPGCAICDPPDARDVELARLRALLDAGTKTLEAKERELAQNREDWKALRAENERLKNIITSKGLP